MWLLLGEVLSGHAPGRPPHGAHSQAQCLLQQIRELPGQLASYALAHSLGCWLVYPSSTFLMTRPLLLLLRQGQKHLMERYRGRRAKLVACDGNEIDTMFMDRHQQLGRHRCGLLLVICCKGNAGFYRMGCLSAPLEAGCLVLGWNHPGFRGSTGAPFPQHDTNAMDVVVNYVLHCTRGGLRLVHRRLHGYLGHSDVPRAGALVLDATFDDPVLLALRVMPRSWKGLLVCTVREHFNLSVAEQMCHYLGPVLLLHRTQDEVLSTSGSLLPLPSSDLEGSRGNELLLLLLQHLYPTVITHKGLAVVIHWLRARNLPQEAAFCARYRVDDKWCLALLHSYCARCKDEPDEEVWGLHGLTFPWLVGQGLSLQQRQQLALFLARKHLKNIEATHCSPLELEDSQLPWRL